MRAASPISSSQQASLTALLCALPDEAILRIRRAGNCWECSNRDPAGASPGRPAFRTASITKTFTAALVLLLCEQGELSLDDSLSAHLEPALLERIHVLGGTSYGAQITLEQLLQHRSGLFDYATCSQFRDHVAQDPLRSWAPLDLLAEAVQAGTPDFAPGQGMNYSDTGYVLLAMAIEKVTGLPLAQAYRERLLEPLGLTNTWLEGREAARFTEVSHAFAGNIDTAAFNPSFDTYGGGGLVSTAADLDRFISCLLGGSVFRQVDTLLHMMEGTDAAPGSGTRKTRTAAGLSAFVVADHLFWGHLGHWNSFMLYSMERDISICGTFNQSKDDLRHVRLLEAAATAALEGCS